MTLAEKQQSLIDDLNIIHDPHERLNAVVSRGASMKLGEAHKIDANLVPGCVSRVWLHGELVNGRTRFACDAESPMVKGLAALLCELYTDSNPAEAAAVEPNVWEACGFHQDALSDAIERPREHAETHSRDGGRLRQMTKPE
jgi:cysteine desulfuration protein SufE